MSAYPTPRPESTHNRLYEFAKTVLIKIFVHPYTTVCDFYCGGGPDTEKWEGAQISYYIGIDVSSSWISEVRGAWESQRRNFTAEFFEVDPFNKYVALKIQKSAQQFAQAALHEIEILSCIADGDPSSSRCIVRLVDHFKHVGPNGQHLCMVLEFLGDSLLGLIKFNRYKGLELSKVREICKCILMGLDYLHRELGIIHTDLKLENILLFSTIDPAKDPIRAGHTPVLERPEGGVLNGGSTMNMIEKKLKRRAKRAFANISGRRQSLGGEALKSERSLDGIDVR